MNSSCDMCDVHTAPVDVWEALVLDLHRAFHPGWESMREAFLRFGNDAQGLMQIKESTFSETKADADRRRTLEGQARACLIKGDKRGHKRAMKELRTQDALHRRADQ